MEGAGVGGWAHPRSRGENLQPSALTGIKGGSSPLTRGKLDRPESPAPGPRLIPAHAGKTAWRSCPTCPRQAHPRSRGENIGHECPPSLYGGSSPLTRGKRLPRYHWYQFYRLIPAHAGKTRRSAPQSGASPAHPRSRGENATQPCVSRLSAGSSPLTRGKRAER